MAKKTVSRGRGTGSPDDVLRKTLNNIKPSGDMQKAAATVVEGLRQPARKAGLDVEFMIGGSVAKGTDLEGDADVDVFARFSPKKHAGDDLSELLARILPKDAERVHGSRDYFQFRRKLATEKGTGEGAKGKRTSAVDVLFEVVPVLRITDPTQAKNVTDMSPLHVGYVLAAIAKRPGLADEIRLAKRFCKAAKCYGAESYINGFSGHVIDLLILKHGSFQELLAAAAKWKGQVVIDLSGRKDALLAIDKSKRQGPLVLVDPVQPGRNAAAALSQEKLDLFREAAKAWLKRPEQAFFDVVVSSEQTVTGWFEWERKKNRFGAKPRLFLIRTDAADGKDDIVATKLKMAHEYLLRQAALQGFEPLGQGWEYDRKKRSGLHWLVFADETLPATREFDGPPLRATKDVTAFRKKHRDAREKDGRLVATVQRKFRTPEEFLKAALKDPYVKGRMKKARLR